MKRFLILLATIAEVGRQLHDCQVTHGGNILMVQVENEIVIWDAPKDALTFLDQPILAENRPATDLGAPQEAQPLDAASRHGDQYKAAHE